MWDVRRAAVETLGRLKDARAVEALTRTLADKDADVREATAIALGGLSDRRAIGPLVLALKDSTSGVRRIAAAALSRIDENWSASPEARAAVEELKPALYDRDPDVRHFVGQLLVSLGAVEPEAAPETSPEEMSASTVEKAPQAGGQPVPGDSVRRGPRFASSRRRGAGPVGRAPGRVCARPHVAGPRRDGPVSG